MWKLFGQKKGHFPTRPWCRYSGGCELQGDAVMQLLVSSGPWVLGDAGGHPDVAVLSRWLPGCAGPSEHTVWSWWLCWSENGDEEKQGVFSAPLGSLLFLPAVPMVGWRSSLMALWAGSTRRRLLGAAQCQLTSSHYRLACTSLNTQFSVLYTVFLQCFQLPKVLSKSVLCHHCARTALGHPAEVEPWSGGSCTRHSTASSFTHQQEKRWRKNRK